MRIPPAPPWHSIFIWVFILMCVRGCDIQDRHEKWSDARVFRALFGIQPEPVCDD